jgi:hypothetical protein
MLDVTPYERKFKAPYKHMLPIVLFFLLIKQKKSADINSAKKTSRLLRDMADVDS